MPRKQPEVPVGHSPLGGSAAERYLTCLAAPAMARGHDKGDSEYSVEGHAAHAVAEYCLISGADAWTLVGKEYVDSTNQFVDRSNTPTEGRIEVTKNMADAVQVYLNSARQERAFVCSTYGECKEYVERSFHCPSLHPLYYGRADRVTHYARTLVVTDYKHGVGVVVEADDNTQMKYYAGGVLESLHLWGKVDKIILRIVQPRAFHFDGPIREWETTPAELKAWLYDTLLPGMRAAETFLSMSYTDIMRWHEEVAPVIVPGEHCRFCPVRGCCPAMVEVAAELEDIMAKAKDLGGAPNLSNDEVGRVLVLNEALKIFIKAVQETGYARASNGATIPGCKMVKARANRVWREDEDVQAEAIKLFGDDAFTMPTLKSPAAIDDLPKGSAFTKRYAFKPDAGLRLVADTDTRSEAGPKTRAMFIPVT